MCIRDSVYFIWKIYLYFSIGNGEPRQPALCQMYRHTFVPYCVHVTKHFDVGLYRTLNQKPTSSLLSCRPELKLYLPCCGKKARNRSTEFHIIIQPFDLIHTGCEHSSILWRPTCRLRVFFLYICYADTLTRPYGATVCHSIVRTQQYYIKLRRLMLN